MVPSTVQLANIVGGLSMAVDLAERKVLQHAQDVTYLALRLAQSIGLSSREKDILYFSALLHDITYTSKGRICPICEAAKEYDLEHLIPSIFEVDKTLHLINEWWDGSGPQGLAGDNIPVSARLLALAVGVDNAGGHRGDFWKWRQRVQETLKNGRRNRFDPLLVQALEELLRERRFCLEMFDPNYDLKIQSFRPSESINTENGTLNIIGKTFAIFIDTKTSYTANHSLQVAEVAGLMAKSLGKSENEQQSVYLAGLLHDLGKIIIPNSILEKTGPLSDEEFAVIKNHPYYSALILSRIPEFETLSVWASAHHERIDGTGYYLGMKGEEIPLEARLIAVADVYSALAAHRPYRKGMSNAKIVEIMHDMAKNNHLDKKLVGMITDLLSGHQGDLFGNTVQETPSP